ncbi:MAG: aspartate-semialdehyde dehydrogenase [Bacillota bacterium]
MKDLNLAVVGATGAVGQEMIKILEQRNFPVKNIKFIASKKSEGKKLTFLNKEVIVESIDENTFKNIDIALFSIASSLSKKYAVQAANSGAIVIDNSNAFRMDEEVPLVVPEINEKEIYKNTGIIANPNCSTIQLVMAINKIHEKFNIKRMIVNTYQAVSGTGQKAIEELKNQIRDFINNKELQSNVYPHQIAFNLLPHIDDFKDNGYTREELKVKRETKKILDDQSMAITSTAVRVPVFYGHGEAVNIELKNYCDLDEIKNIISNTKNVKLVDNIEKNSYPMPINVENDDNVLVGRLRKDYSQKNSFNMWIVANNLRKGAALNAVQIAEKLI